MKALAYTGELELIETETPVPSAGEALIRLTMAGICNTDIEILKGYMGFRGILGHEFVGIVEDCAESHWIDKRVVGEINCVCKACAYCLAGMPNHCLNRTVLGILNRNGAFAEYLCLPIENLHLVPDKVPDETAVFTEPVAAAFRITEQTPVHEHDRVIVLGDGKLAQLIAQVLWLHTRQLVVIGKHAWKLAILSRQGIPTALHTDPVESGADLVIEATGSSAGIVRALELVRPEGTVVLKSTVARNSSLPTSLPVINEIQILGSRCGPFPPALDALALGNVEVHPLVTEVFPLEDGVRALERAIETDVMKVLLRM